MMKGLQHMKTFSPLLLILLAGCGSSSSSSPPNTQNEAGAPETGTPADTGTPTDTGAPDTGPPADTGTPDTGPPPRTEPFYVFVSSVTMDGSLQNGTLGTSLNPITAASGLARADEICKKLADNSTNTDIRNRSWMAWLSDATGSPSTRFRSKDGAFANLGYVLTNTAKTSIAANWAALITTGPTAHITPNQTGADFTTTQYVWTATAENGTYDTVHTSCTNWSATTNSVLATVGTNNATTSASVPTNWTKNNNSTCDFARPIYCFEQPAP